MGQVAGDLDDPPGFPYTPPGLNVLEGSSSPTMWRSVRTTLCRALRLPAVLFPNQAVMQPVRMLSTVQV